MSDILDSLDEGASGAAAEQVAGVYGEPPVSLVDVPEGAIQFSPTRPGSRALEACSEGVLPGFTMVAPAGTIERRTALALALRATRAGGAVTVLAAKDRGGLRLRRELAAFGCEPAESARRHHRICVTTRPAHLTDLDAALAAGAPRLVEPLDLWSQPGIFSWDRIDPGSALLAPRISALAGAGADLGCGIGFLARHALRSPGVTRLAMVDIDRRAVECARRNVPDPRASALWADLRAGAGEPGSALAGLDFVVTNPAFHEQGAEDRGLGQAFIRAAAAALRRGGHCWLVANRHLPYETLLDDLFADVTVVEERDGYKVFRARK